MRTKHARHLFTSSIDLVKGYHHHKALKSAYNKHAILTHKTILHGLHNIYINIVTVCYVAIVEEFEI